PVFHAGVLVPWHMASHHSSAQGRRSQGSQEPVAKAGGWHVPFLARRPQELRCPFSRVPVRTCAAYPSSIRQDGSDHEENRTSAKPFL
ncbi:MAG: hypothetical protein OXC57_15005, partial [Rhodobacteraceae bacterium]|nr:hypothetical protein [Paracoccaceae bacterium]